MAERLEATPAGPVMLIHAAVYDERDADRAELLLLSAGTIAGATDPDSVPPRDFCPECDMAPARRGHPGGVRIVSDEVSGIDVFRDRQLWFLHERLVEALSETTGLVTRPTQCAVSGGPFFEVSAAHTLGYPSHAVRRDDACPACGRRRGTSLGDSINGYREFPRAAWNGDDFVTSSNSPNRLYVSQRAYRILVDPRWRSVGPGVEGRPVHLVDDVPPIR